MGPMSPVVASERYGTSLVRIDRARRALGWEPRFTCRRYIESEREG